MSIRILGVSRAFGNFQALSQVDLHVPSGSLTALLGPSGSGKTTLLRIIAGLESADTGQVQFDNRDVTSLAARDRGVGFVFQHYALFRHMSVAENIAFGLRVRRVPGAEVKLRVTELLRLVRLEGLGNRLPSELSGGQRQRLAIARALLLKPRVLIFDEATSALDPESEAIVMRNLSKIAANRTVILISHRLSTLVRSDRIAFLEHGRLLDCAPHAQLLESCESYRSLWRQQMEQTG